MQAGDLVKLKSGGPIMTVRSVHENNIECEWFDKENTSKPNSYNFLKDSLHIHVPPTKEQISKAFRNMV